MTVNKKGEETGAISFVQFIERLLRESATGVFKQEEVEAAILDEPSLGGEFGPSDLRMKKVGRSGKMPKWKSNLDWCKALLRRQFNQGDNEVKWLVRRKGKTKYFVHLTRASEEWRTWVAVTKTKPSFMKKCKSCKARNALSMSRCHKCGKAFPTVTRKLHKTTSPDDM